MPGFQSEFHYRAQADRHRVRDLRGTFGIARVWHIAARVREVLKIRPIAQKGTVLPCASYDGFGMI